jgi:RNA polymerase sigma-70 factor (ECF subfamily)
MKDITQTKDVGRIRDWEGHLVAQAAHGDAVAFELIIDEFRPILTKVAMRMLRNADDASDAVQETFVKAFRGIEAFDPNRPLRPWLCRICSNCCIDIARNRRHDAESLDAREATLADPSSGVEEIAANTIQGRQVKEAIGRLPSRYREIIILRHFRHMDITEIASAMNKPEGTIKSWLFRARAMLKKDLAPALG